MKLASVSEPSPSDAATDAPSVHAGCCLSGVGGPWLIVMGLLCALWAVGLSGEEGPPLRIGTIEIASSDVFSDEEADRGWAYRLTNSLHIKTKEGVIRNLLLFREGNPYVPSQLEESERILRAKHFLSAASVTASEPHDGVVDVVVSTRDSWSLQPGGTLGSAGGETDFSFAIEENNFLGYGKELTTYYASDVDRTGLGVRYWDPAVLGSRWNAGALLASNSDGTQIEVGVDRPFYSFATPWAVSTGAADRQYASRVYANGVVVDEFNQEHRALSAGYGIALAPNDLRAHRVSFGIDWQADDFTPLPTGVSSTLPHDRDYRYLFASYEYARNRFAKVHYLNRDQRFEDLRIGPRFSLQLGVSPAALGAERTTGLIAAEISKGFEIGAAVVLVGTSLQSRVGADHQNGIASVDLNVIRQYEGVRFPQTTVGRLRLTYGRDLDPDLQFFADGSTGLRAYRLHAFAGDSSIIVNLEHRIFLGRELWRVLSPGAVVFVDAGNAAYGSEAFKTGNLKLDAGFGLRLGLTRTSSRTFRLDFAYAFDPDPFGDRGWLVSFSGGQAF